MDMSGLGEFFFALAGCILGLFPSILCLLMILIFILIARYFANKNQNPD